MHKELDSARSGRAAKLRDAVRQVETLYEELIEWLEEQDKIEHPAYEEVENVLKMYQQVGFWRLKDSEEFKSTLESRLKTKLLFRVVSSLLPVR